MPFGFHRRHHAEIADVEWFRSFGEVPGIDWAAPFEVKIDERLANARPVALDPHEIYDGGPTYRWVDRKGEPIGEPYAFDSPAGLIRRRSYEERPERQLELSVVALAHPGMRYDYAEALADGERVIQFEGLDRCDVLEGLLQAHVSLMLAGPGEALARPLRGYEPPLDRASDPFMALISLYQREGFLREAIGVERLLEVLPADARPRYMPEPRPSEIAEALRRLR